MIASPRTTTLILLYVSYLGTSTSGIILIHMFIYDAVVFLKHAGKTLLSARGKKLKFVKHEFLTSKDACSNRVRNAIFLLFFLFIFHFCFSIMVARRVFVIFLWIALL